MKYSIIVAVAELSVIVAQSISSYDGPQIIGVYKRQIRVI